MRVRNTIDQCLHERRCAESRKRLPFFVQCAIVIIRDASNDHEGLRSIALDRSNHLIDLRVEAQDIALVTECRLQIIIRQEILPTGDHSEANGRSTIIFLRAIGMFHIDDLSILHFDVQTVVARRETVDVVREKGLHAFFEKLLPGILVCRRSTLLRLKVILFDRFHQLIQLETLRLVTRGDELVPFLGLLRFVDP